MPLLAGAALFMTTTLSFTAFAKGRTPVGRKIKQFHRYEQEKWAETWTLTWRMGVFHWYVDEACQ